MLTDARTMYYEWIKRVQGSRIVRDSTVSRVVEKHASSDVRDFNTLLRLMHEVMRYLIRS